MSGKQQLSESGNAADDSFSNSEAGKSHSDCGSTRTWVGVKMVGEDEHPIAGLTFRITAADGKLVAEGKLDSDGMAMVEHLPDTGYEVFFPDLDFDAWEPA